jgi:hypothetical protein
MEYRSQKLVCDSFPTKVTHSVPRGEVMRQRNLDDF